MPSERFDDEPTTATTNNGRPPTREHKYSTADMKPERPWKRICCTILSCLVCIAIMILISLLMQKLFDPPEDEDWSDDAVNATDDEFGAEGHLVGAPQTLPKTMDFIEDVCSETRLGSDDKRACQEACKPAKDCCNPFDGNSTCFETEPAGCFSYSKCHSLDGYIDAAHNDLDRICSKASLEFHREECELACLSVQCCFTPEESCLFTQFQACMDYAACQNLKEGSLAVAPVNLDQECEKDTATCKNDCKEAICCSDPNSECYRDNFIACLSYSACNGKSDVTTISIAPVNSRVDPSAYILPDICSIKGFAEYGTAKCLSACAPVQCCWASGADNCFGDDPLGCLEYEPCTILKTPPYDQLTFPPTAHRPAAPAPAPTQGASAPGAGAGAGAGVGAATEAPLDVNATAPEEAALGGNETEAAAPEPSPPPTAGPALKADTAGRRMRG